MALLRPFRGVSYDQSKAGPLVSLLSPPQDAISAERFAALQAGSPFHFGHLDLCHHHVGMRVSAEQFVHAGHRYRSWLQQGILRRDETPAYYLLEETFLKAGAPCQRLSVIGAVQVQPYAARVILPHERTLDGAKQDRLQLLRALRAQLSPILLLVDDQRATLLGWRQRVVGPPLFTVEAVGGVSTTLYRVDDPELMHDITARWSLADMVIADGHHRYETALAYLDEAGSSGHGHYVMASMMAAGDSDMVLDPFHRLLDHLSLEEVDAWQRYHAAHAQCRPVTSDDPETWRSVLEDASAARPAYLLLLQRGTGLEVLLVEWPAPSPSDASPLAVQVLHETVLPALTGLDVAAQASLPASAFASDALELAARLRVAQSGVGVLLPSLRYMDVLRVCRQGLPLPQKSTRFHPKPPGGLIVMDVDAASEAGTS